jgi:hypothetical protein
MSKQVAIWGKTQFWDILINTSLLIYPKMRFSPSQQCCLRSKIHLENNYVGKSDVWMGEAVYTVVGKMSLISKLHLPSKLQAFFYQSALPCLRQRSKGISFIIEQKSTCKRSLSFCVRTTIDAARL